MRQLAIATLLIWAVGPAASGEPIKVVTTLPAYASIAQIVGGANIEAASIARGDEDAHFVKPKPSYALMLRDASLFVTTGLDLELWAPVLVDKSGNRVIRDGQPGFVSASQNVPLLEVPASASREAGDIHIYGNPHIFTSPLNAKIIAANIANGLTRIDTGNGDTYSANLRAFQDRIDEALYGVSLLDVLDSSTLDPLAQSGELISFLESQEYGGRPLLELLGGWLGRSLPIRGQKIVAYHKNWIYFAQLFGLQIVDYVEPKPGIPPSARHVHELIETIQNQRVRVVWAANYFSPRQPQAIAERTGCQAVIVPLGPGLAEAPDYFALVDLWVDRLAEAFTR